MIEKRLKELGVSLPPAPAPVASYNPWIITGNLVFISGQLPLQNGILSAKGKLGRDLSLEEGILTTRIAALNALAQLKAALGSLETISQFVRLTGYINSAPGFTDQPLVLNGASNLLAELFGERGRHARVAVGVSELPLDSPVEIELIAEFST